MNGIEIRPVNVDISFWKRLPKDKVPTDKDSQRKQEIFWYFLQNNLQKPRRKTVVKEKTQRDDIDRKPLIAPPTHMNVIVTHQEGSPASDDAFVYA
ncbi:hypothetical protein DPMN_110297 [Dreissena polymorpha]|uniref:Uncharacterized protein n=1 Tax=Dreissena polymorpha TaxID=45954 RepID=A0A9D4KCW4_DREPO|nr:hypothetical protein DPMN_110297 [Dreissena polymorpha]